MNTLYRCVVVVNLWSKTSIMRGDPFSKFHKLLSTISTEIMVRCGPCTFGDFKCAYVSLHFFELQHYENRVAKKYADTNNNRLS